MQHKTEGGHQDITLKEPKKSHTHRGWIRRVSRGRETHFATGRMARNRTKKEQTDIMHTDERSQKDQIVRGRNACISILLPSLPPSAAHIRYFQDLVLGEADFVGVFRVGVI